MKLISSPNTPGAYPNTARNGQALSADMESSPLGQNTVPCPSSLCRWAIHVKNEEYERVPSPPPDHEQRFDPYDEATWQAWPLSEQKVGFQQQLQYGLESNDFSNLKQDQLPIAVAQVAKAVHRSPDEMLKESLGFSIMGRNLDLVRDILDQMAAAKVDITEVHPLHIATSYLDGSKTCCLVLDLLCCHRFNYHLNLPLAFWIRKLHTNHLGHTVLDNLMIAVLKAHSSCRPGTVDKTWAQEKRFVGEDVDICGRWDADSSCVREAVALGVGEIPVDWKHKFCHTSAQTICHCISSLFYHGQMADINTSSGLFVERCFECGLKLQPRPLHTLVLTAFVLAQSNFEGEDLFGILACALCLLFYKADPLLTASLSLSAYSGMQIEQCDHDEICPLQLAVQLEDMFSNSWSNQVRTGWKLLCYVLGEAQHEARRTEDGLENNETDEDKNGDTTDDEYTCKFHGNRNKMFHGKTSNLGTLWAVVQAEMLTYRRLNSGDPWASENFDMHALLQCLLNGGGVNVGLLQKGLLNNFERCGMYRGEYDCCPTMEDVSRKYFSNLDDYYRTTFVDMPERYYS